MPSAFLKSLAVGAANSCVTQQCQERDKRSYPNAKKDESRQLTETGEDWLSDDESQESETEEQSEAEEDEQEDWSEAEEEEADDHVDENGADDDGASEQSTAEEKTSAKAASPVKTKAARTVTTSTTRPIAAVVEVSSSNTSAAVSTSCTRRPLVPSASKQPTHRLTASSALSSSVEPDSPVVEVHDDEEEEEEHDEDEYDGSEEGRSSLGNSEIADENDGSGELLCEREWWERSAAFHGRDYEDGLPSSEDSTAALYNLSDSVAGLSYNVANVTPALYSINSNLGLLSQQQLYAPVACTTTARTNRCAELGWPAATMSLLTVLLLLILPLSLPWAWERFE